VRNCSNARVAQCSSTALEFQLCCAGSFLGQADPGRGWRTEFAWNAIQFCTFTGRGGPGIGRKVLGGVGNCLGRASHCKLVENPAASSQATVTASLLVLAQGIPHKRIVVNGVALILDSDTKTVKIEDFGLLEWRIDPRDSFSNGTRRIAEPRAEVAFAKSRHNKNPTINADRDLQSAASLTAPNVQLRRKLRHGAQICECLLLVDRRSITTAAGFFGLKKARRRRAGMTGAGGGKARASGTDHKKIPLSPFAASSSTTPVFWCRGIRQRTRTCGAHPPISIAPGTYVQTTSSLEPPRKQVPVTTAQDPLMGKCCSQDLMKLLSRGLTVAATETTVARPRRAPLLNRASL